MHNKRNWYDSDVDSATDELFSADDLFVRNISREELYFKDVSIGEFLSTYPKQQKLETAKEAEPTKVGRPRYISVETTYQSLT